MADDRDYRDMLAERHGHVMEAIAQVNQTLAALAEYQRVANSRLSTLELKVAVLDERNPNPARQGGMWGALGGAVAGFIAGFAK